MNERLLQTRDPLHVDVILRQVEKAELDEMWSFVGSKSQQRWLWHAIDPLSLSRFMVYGMMRLWHHDTVTGGTTHGRCTVR